MRLYWESETHKSLSSHYTHDDFTRQKPNRCKFQCHLIHPFSQNNWSIWKFENKYQDLKVPWGDFSGDLWRGGGSTQGMAVFVGLLVCLLVPTYFKYWSAQSKLCLAERSLNLSQTRPGPTWPVGRPDPVLIIDSGLFLSLPCSNLI